MLVDRQLSVSQTSMFIYESYTGSNSLGLSYTPEKAARTLVQARRKPREDIEYFIVSYEYRGQVICETDRTYAIRVMNFLTSDGRGLCGRC